MKTKEQHRHENNTRLPFGKHKGRRICDTPSDYLAWLSSAGFAEPWLTAAVEAELTRRNEAGSNTGDTEQERSQTPHATRKRIPPGVRLDIALQLIEAGRRSLALKRHPDIAGGDTAIMQGVLATSDWLSEYLAEVLS